MGDPIINTCLLPFIVSFARLLNPCDYFCNVDCVVFKLTSRKPIETLISLQAYWHALLKARPKHEPCPKIESSKGI